ncbi:hypothetical protein LrhR19_00125 [Lacticaseibacillus rhamnosus]|nr:hypothetical protein ACS99_11200 [Lacticaseibacillus rhamnosus]OAK78566.1 hypothetical protein LrhR19_00125 [Lacticaseibacillus rhamnosus]OFP85142.1 hypothetical protein HMPREF2969_06495 [Lactobacillus sp. HMSC056D05]OHF13357.1 hypothetical protein BKP38_09005 [Lacticaseibacillus rhamnosus]
MILDISALIAIIIGPRQTNFVWSGPICFSYFAKSSGKSVQMVTWCHLNFKYRQQSVLFANGYVASRHLAKSWIDLGCCYFSDHKLPMTAGKSPFKQMIGQAAAKG